MEVKPLLKSQGTEDPYFMQFAIHLEAGFSRPGWLTERVGRLTLSRSESLPRLRLCRSGQTCAIVLGWVVHGDRFFAADTEMTLDSSTTLDELHRNLVGRFVMLTVEPTGDVSVRLDAAGQLPVVYDQDSARAGSSPVALAMFRDLAVDEGVLAEVRRSDGTTWFPFGIVPYQGVKRLLPGQVLQMSTQVLSRANTVEMSRQSNPDQVVQSILKTLDRVVVAISRSGNLTAHLTAGVDSRMILAASLHADVKLSLITIRGDDTGSKLDDLMARRIAKKCSVHHRSIPLLPADAEEIGSWHHRAGYCIDDTIVGLCRTVRESYDGSTVLTGVCGEVGRAFFWSITDLGKTGIEPTDLLSRLGFEPTPMLIDLAVRWLDEIGITRSRGDLLDRAYIEQRLACWAGAAVNGHAIPAPTISPFNGGLLYDQMLSLPEQLRAEGELPICLMRAAYPNLLDFPFNRATGLSRLRFPKQEIKRHLPPGVKRKLRRLLPIGW